MFPQIVRTGVILFFALAFVATAPASGAEPEQLYQYAAKFACGSSDGSGPMAAGDYATALNLRNPTDQTVRLRAKVMPTYIGGAVIQPVVESEESNIRGMLALQPYEARGLGCEQILDRVPDAGDELVEGFVVILSVRSLDVVVVYTASGNGEVAMDVETIAQRLVQREWEGPEEGKVEICHVPPGNPGNAHTIEVDASALPAHLAHGDYEGECIDDDDDVHIDDDDDDDEPWSSGSSGRRRPGSRF
ncbi:MAG: hypothetical protein JRS35_02765 [Deltaproteobacteria bacterium]|nr:hypothetical protein [Deltaproteobacteria bacterium]